MNNRPVLNNMITFQSLIYFGKYLSTYVFRFSCRLILNEMRWSISVLWYAFNGLVCCESRSRWSANIRKIIRKIIRFNKSFISHTSLFFFIFIPWQLSSKIHYLAFCVNDLLFYSFPCRVDCNICHVYVCFYWIFRWVASSMTMGSASQSHVQSRWFDESRATRCGSDLVNDLLANS